METLWEQERWGEQSGPCGSLKGGCGGAFQEPRDSGWAPVGCRLQPPVSSPPRTARKIWVVLLNEGPTSQLPEGATDGYDCKLAASCLQAEAQRGRAGQQASLEAEAGADLTLSGGWTGAEEKAIFLFSLLLSFFYSFLCHSLPEAFHLPGPE